MVPRKVLAAAAVLCLAAPAAEAAPGQAKDLRWKSVDRFGREAVQKYAHLHRKWTKRAGRKVVGRQIARYGMPRKGRDRLASRAEWRHTMTVFRRWEHPPPPPSPVPTVSSPTSAGMTAYSASTGCGGITPYPGGGQCWAIPYDIVVCESGGRNVPNAQGSGAQGYYQLMVGGYGSKAQQDAAAAELWNGGAGRSNWVC